MDAETCKRELVIQIPFDVVRKEAEAIATQYARKARVPGFRPGHIPRDFILRRFQDAIREEVAETLLPKFFSDAVKSQNFAVVGEPSFEDLKFEEEKPLTAKATFEIYPQIEIGDYKGLEVSEGAPAVTDADVDEALEVLRERAVTFEVVEDRPSAAGDLLNVSYEGRDAKSPKSRLVDVKDGLVRLGDKGTLPEFTANLTGVRPGDVREFDVIYPADSTYRKLAGKTVHFRVQVQAVKQKVLPPLDDELAKTLSSALTLEALRAEVRRGLEQDRQRETEARTKRKLVESLMGRQSFPVPESLVEERLHQRLRSMAARLYDQGIDPASAGINWAKMRAELREEAEKDVRTSLILDKVADAEGIEVSEEEIDEAVRDLAAGSEESPAALKSRLTRNGGLAKLRTSRRNQNALEFIYRNARVVRQLSLV